MGIGVLKRILQHTILYAIAVIAPCVGFCASKNPSPKLKIQSPDTVLSTNSLASGSLLTDTLKNALSLDSLTTDSTALSDKAPLNNHPDTTLAAPIVLNPLKDTIRVRGGVLPIMQDKLLEDLFTVRDGDSVKTKPVKVVRPPSLASTERSRLFKDTLTFGTVSALSFAIPGFGQLYNKQYWKIPVLYGSVAGFSVAASHAGKMSRQYSSMTDVATNTAEDNDHYKLKSNNYQTQRTLYLAGAVVSYLYFVGDAAINYKGAVHSTRKATILSAIFPGAGQVYNKSYWKLPIVYGGFATFGYVIDYNNRGYKRFSKAYTYLTDNDPSTVDEFNGRYDASLLQNTRDSYRRYRDLGIILMSGFYLLNIIDAHVDAYLRRYEISNDLSMRVEPSMTEGPRLSGRSSSDVMGMSLKVNF